MTVTASLRDAHRKSAKDPVAVVIGGYDTPRSGQTPRSRGSNRRFEDVLATHKPTFARTSTTTTAPTVTPTARSWALVTPFRNRSFFFSADRQTMTPTSTTNFLVTGATSGLGLELVRKLLERRKDARVVLGT